MISRFWKDLQLTIEKFLLKPRSRRTLQKFILITFGITIFVTTYLLSIPYLARTIKYKQGDIAEEYIRVSKDINFEIKEETLRKKEDAYNKAPYIFTRDYNIYKKVVEQVSAEFGLIMSSLSSPADFEKLKLQFPFLNNPEQIKAADVRDLLFYHDNSQELIHWVNEYATLVFDNFGILDKLPDSPEQLDENGVRIITESEGKESELNWNSDKIVFYKDIFNRNNFARFSNIGDKSFSGKIKSGARKIITLRVLQIYYQNPYTHYNNYETLKRRQDAASHIKPVYGTLKKGLTIARPGDPIDSEKLRQIQLLNEHQGKTSFKNILGIFLIQTILLLTIAIYIYQFSDFSMRDLGSYTILLSLIYSILIYSFIASRISAIQSSNIYFILFIPMVYMSVISCILLGARITFAAGVYLSIFLYYLSGFEIATLIISITSVLTGNFATLRMNRRSDFFNAAMLSGFFISVATLGIELTTNRFGQNTQLTIIFSFFNAFLSIVLAMGILPIYEGIFNIPTRFRLIELSDINNPLLKRLSTEAPSSYSHSLLMSSMSEKAVASIDGDTLLTRVGCLYHDIGKLLNVGIYAENKNPEDLSDTDPELDPQEYAQTIIKHVSDGIELGREYRLPEKVIAFIPEHHGTSLMHYFYHEALEKVAGTRHKIPDKQIFQYPGPRPQSKETAVVMLADSIEAASRTISDTSKENYQKLIENIFKIKNEEGQLDECNLTLVELRKIKESFLETLMSTFHMRPKYPTKLKTLQLERNISQNKNKGNRKNGKN